VGFLFSLCQNRDAVNGGYKEEHRGQGLCLLLLGNLGDISVCITLNEPGATSPALGGDDGM